MLERPKLTMISFHWVRSKAPRSHSFVCAPRLRRGPRPLALQSALTAGARRAVATQAQHAAQAWGRPPSGSTGGPPGTASAAPCGRTGRCGPGGSRLHAGPSPPRGQSAARDGGVGQAGAKQIGRGGRGGPLTGGRRNTAEPRAEQTRRCAANDMAAARRRREGAGGKRACSCQRPAPRTAPGTHLVHARQRVHHDRVLFQLLHRLCVDDVLALGLLIVVRPAGGCRSSGTRGRAAKIWGSQPWRRQQACSGKRRPARVGTGMPVRELPCALGEGTQGGVPRLCAE